MNLKSESVLRWLLQRPQLEIQAVIMMFMPLVATLKNGLLGTEVWPVWESQSENGWRLLIIAHISVSVPGSFEYGKQRSLESIVRRHCRRREEKISD